MGIIFKALKDNEVVIDLTEFSIKNIDFIADTDLDFDQLQYNDITRDIKLEGVINAESVTDKKILKKDEFGEPILDEYGEEQYELREIDSVRKLANWALIPEYEDNYLDVEIEITNSKGDLVKKENYTNIFVCYYLENFGDEKGKGDFTVLLRERELRLEEIKGTNVYLI